MSAADWIEVSTPEGLRVAARTGRRYRIRLDLITLRDFGEVLGEVDAREGLIAARRLAAALDYQQLVTLCRRWHDDPEGETDNDPNRWVHPRFMLLPFMDDALVPEDARDGLYPGDGAGPVQEMTRAILDAGVPCKESAVFDEDVLVAYRAWRAQQAEAAPA